MPPAPSRFDLINHRLRQVALTVVLWSAALVCVAEAVGYLIALLSGDQPDPPSLLRMLGVGDDTQ